MYNVSVIEELCNWNYFDLTYVKLLVKGGLTLLLNRAQWAGNKQKSEAVSEEAEGLEDEVLQGLLEQLWKQFRQHVATVMNLVPGKNNNM